MADRARALWSPVAGLAVVALVFASCSSLTIEGTSLEGTHWRAISVAGQPPVAGSAPTLRFEGGRISGSAGCNSYSSSEPVTISSGRLELGTALMTLGACVGSDGENLPLMAIEGAFWQALGANEQIRLRGAQLVISGPKGELVFDRTQ